MSSERALGLVRWWLAELSAMAPTRLLSAGAASGRVVAVLGPGGVFLHRETGAGAEVLGNAATADELAPLLARAGHLPLVLRLPAGRSLARNVVLPLAAEASLRRALAFEMDRLTPWPAAEVLFDARVTGRDPGRGLMEVGLVVARRDEVEDLLERARSIGLSVDAVEAEGVPGLDLMPPGVRRRRHLAVRLAAGFAALAVLGGMAGLGVAVDRREEAARALMAEASLLSGRAEAAHAMRREIEILDADWRFLSAARRATPAAVAVLDDLTRVLPDDAFLSQVDIRRGEVEIVGWARSASVVVRRLEQAGPFADAQFRSPLVQDSRMGGERFHIAARLAGGGG